MIKRSIIVCIFSILCFATIALTQNNNYQDRLSRLLPPEQQQKCGLQKLSQAERDSLSELFGIFARSISLGDSAVEYLKNEGWEEVRVVGTRQLKLNDSSYEENYLIVEKRSTTYILNPRGSSLSPGKYLGKMGSSSCEIIDSGGNSVSFRVEDRR